MQYCCESGNIINEEVNYVQARKSKIKKNKLISIKYIMLFMTDTMLLYIYTLLL